MEASGRLHADDRIQHGFTFRSVIAEFRALRATVLRLYANSGATDLAEATRFNEAIDESLTASMDRFAAQTDKFRDQFIGVLSHDLRTPLGAITAGAALLALPEDNPQRVEIPPTPPLAEAIRMYAQRHADVIELACAPVAVPGGEKIKTELHFIESMQQTLFDLHLDRHSYVIAVGGGVGTYLRHKRQHILETMPHRHLLIVPGSHDQVLEEERAITVTIASPKVPGSPNYRLMLRNRAVRATLERFKPDIVECQDAYNLPWAALGHARRHPGTALVAAYMTDFPTVYVERPFRKFVGATLAGAASRLCYWYCGQLYSRFDGMFALEDGAPGHTPKVTGNNQTSASPSAVRRLLPGRAS